MLEISKLTVCSMMVPFISPHSGPLPPKANGGIKGLLLAIQPSGYQQRMTRGSNRLAQWPLLFTASCLCMLLMPTLKFECMLKSCISAIVTITFIVDLMSLTPSEAETTCCQQLPSVQCINNTILKQLQIY